MVDVNTSGKGGRLLARFADAEARATPRKFWNIIDPVYWFALLLCLPVLKLPLTTTETNIIHLNIQKQRYVMWVTSIFGGVAYWGISQSDKTHLSELILALLAPAFVTGGAWFSISFGGVQEKLIGAAVALTKWMFTAFTISLVTMLIALAHIVPPQITVVLLAVTLLVLLSAITYDNVDSLKIGLDDALRRNSLTMMAKLGREGIWPPIDSEEKLARFVEKAIQNESD